jgi:lipoate-protein ligase A
MLCIYNSSFNPYFNLAAEEYVIKEFNDDIFMLWRNSPAVIVGKNQNTLSEINLEYVRANSIPVVRRLSGGGAVFHDLGNLNFTFISNDASESFTNFRKFTQPIIDVLKKLSIDAEFTGRNDLTIDGRKFSGNAQYNYKNRVLHHGTLLFSSDMTDLSAALRVKESKFEGKSVKSVKSRVTNISDHLKQPLSIMEFKDLIMEHITSIYMDSNIYSFTDNDLNAINKLTEEKYSTYEWNFGYSPKYSYYNEKRFAGGSLEVNIDVERGIIKAVRLQGDFFGKRDVVDIESALIGVRYTADDIREVLLKFEIADYFMAISLDDLIEVLI